VALPHLGEVVANLVQIDGDHHGILGRVGVGARLDQHQRVARHHRVADGNGDLADDTRRLGGDDVLHLHRLEHDELLPDPDRIALAHVDGDDGSLHRCGDGLHRHPV